MGIIRDLDYRVPSPNKAQRAVWKVSASRPGSWLFAQSLHHVDKALLAMSHGRVTSAGLLAGIPVLTVTTIGARTNLPRTVPLLGVPYDGDIAIIGTRFGQPGTPGWYYNLRADPRAEVTYRETTVRAAVREASEDERPVIWAAARTIYAGYEAYSRRITGRKIRIMVLSTAVD
jgi:deazaflavin-dependent oxidoreductase (nitroreductase family)